METAVYEGGLQLMTPHSFRMAVIWEGDTHNWEAVV